MRHQSPDDPGILHARRQGGLPAPLDSETLALLRGFLAPILRDSATWEEIGRRLAAKGHGLAFREGHLVIVDEGGEGVCTGAALGVPLRSIAGRIGRPCIRASADGHFGELGGEPGAARQTGTKPPARGS